MSRLRRSDSDRDLCAGVAERWRAVLDVTVRGSLPRNAAFEALLERNNYL